MHRDEMAKLEDKKKIREIFKSSFRVYFHDRNTNSNARGLARIALFFLRRVANKPDGNRGSNAYSYAIACDHVREQLRK